MTQVRKTHWQSLETSDVQGEEATKVAGAFLQQRQHAGVIPRQEPKRHWLQLRRHSILEPLMNHKGVVPKGSTLETTQMLKGRLLGFDVKASGGKKQAQVLQACL